MVMFATCWHMRMQLMLMLVFMIMLVLMIVLLLVLIRGVLPERGATPWNSSHSSYTAQARHATLVKIQLLRGLVVVIISRQPRRMVMFATHCWHVWCHCWLCCWAG